MIPLYELLYGNTIAKQRVVDDFSGDSLNERWTFNTISAGTGATNDVIDGGYKIISNTTSGSGGYISFNDVVRQYGANSKFIASVRLSSTASIRGQVGLIDVHDFSGIDRYSMAVDTPTNANWNLVTEKTSSTVTDTTVAFTTNLTNVSAEMRGTTSAVGWVNGDFSAIATTTLPTLKMQPWAYHTTTTTTGKSMDILYFEAYNT